LAQQDIKVEQFNVDLMGQSPGGLPNQTPHSSSGQQGGNHYAPPAYADQANEAAPVSDPGAARRPGEGSQLNVIV
jgi:hypothetical protein